MQLVGLDVAVAIIVDLLKDLQQGDVLLAQDLDQVVKNLILHCAVFALFLHFTHTVDVIHSVEVLQFLVQDYSVFIGVDLLEQWADLLGFQWEIEVLAKVDLEITECQEPNIIGVHDAPRLLDRHGFLEALLDWFVHSETLHFLVELGLHFLVGSRDVRTWHARRLRHLYLVLELKLFLVLFVLFFYFSGFIREDIIVGVSSPETLDELDIRDVFIVVDIDTLQESSHLLVRQAKIETN